MVAVIRVAYQPVPAFHPEGLSGGPGRADEGGRERLGGVASSALRQGSAKTNSVLPSLGRSSGVIRLNIPDVSDVPVLTATYCRPPAA